MNDLNVSDDQTATIRMPERENASSGTEPELLTVEELAGENIDMPDVKPNAVEAARSNVQKSTPTEQPAAAGARVKGQTDDVGRSFDAMLHEVGPDGKPRINRDGWIAKRRGGGSKGKVPNQSRVHKNPQNPQDTKPLEDPKVREANIAATAQVATAIFLQSCQMIGGEEFKPVIDKSTGEDEPAMIEDSFRNYFRIKGITDIPPGAALAIGLTFFVVKRWNQPKFTKRRQGWFGGVRRWWADFRLRRQIARESRARMEDEEANTAATGANP